MKRIVFCFDGTWNRPDSETPTNVLLTASSIIPKAYEGGVTQVVHYDPGVGTERANKNRGGVFGRGLFDNIEQAYLFLIFNFSPGDEIFVFGFSRGAFTARSFIGFVKSVGIIQRNKVRMISEAIKLYKNRLTVGDLELLDFRSKYSRHITVCPEDESYRCSELPDYTPGEAYPFQFKYLGIWDTVESLGFWKIVKASFSGKSSKKFVASEYRFHDHKLSNIIASGRHAVALDEFKKTFDVEAWGEVDKANHDLGYDSEDESAPFKEQFFPGQHGAVGGGGPVRGLSDAALEWVLEGAKLNGLVLDVSPTSVVYQSKPDFTAPLSNDPDAPTNIKSRILNIGARPRRHQPKNIWEVHKSAKKRWQSSKLQPYRPITLQYLSEELDASPEFQHVEKAYQPGLIEHTPNKEKAIYHTVKKGETLSLIAKLYSGDMMLYPKIFDANRDFIDDEDKIYIGQIIKIPKSIIKNKP